MSARRTVRFKPMATRFKEKGLPGRGGSSDAELARFSGQIMGSTCHITVRGLPNSTTVDILKDAVHAALNDMGKSMSIHKPDSEMSRFNAHESRAPFTVSAGTAGLFRISRQVSEESGGAFDIIVGPPVNAWGFGPEKISPNPYAAMITALRKRVGWQRVEVRDDSTLVKKRPDLRCDLSAVSDSPCFATSCTLSM